MAFAQATAVVPLAAGRYGAIVDGAWSAPAGPNGGYLAAIVLRAALAEVADPARHPRSLTLHYLRSPRPGPVEVAVEVLRAGRSLTSLSVRMTQGDELCVAGLAAFAVDFPSALDYDDAPAPAVRAPEELDVLPFVAPMPPILEQLEVRPALGPPLFSGADEAVIGAWMRLREPAAPDAPILALYLDALFPATFPRLTSLVPCPTVDLTIHFRRQVPADADPAALLLGRFTSRTSADGLFEEDGELWGADGVLLAQSRQLAILRPPRGS